MLALLLFALLAVLLLVLSAWFIYKRVKASIIGTIRRVFNDYRKFVSPHKTAFFEDLEMYFVMGSRKGSLLKDYSGTYPLTNLHCNGGVFNLGHRNKTIIRTLKRALRTYDIGNHHLVSLPRAELARVLGELDPKELKYTIFGVSGGEAMDVAIKLAIGHTKRRKVIVAKGGYHGHTGLALLLGDDQYMEPFAFHSKMNENLEVVRVDFNDAGALDEVLMDETVAAVILETVPATLGFPIPKKSYLVHVRERCSQFGTQLILDEVQTGCGRTGKFFAFQHFGIVPDIVVLGKGLSGGIYPITATLFREHFMDLFEKFPFAHVSTFGGSELGCIVAKKVIEMTTSPSLVKNINALTQFFRKEMDNLMQSPLNALADICSPSSSSLGPSEEKKQLIVEFRQLGLCSGIVTMSEEFAMCLFQQMLKAKLLMVYANNDKRILQFLPPLVMTLKEAREVMKKVRFALAEAIIAFRENKGVEEGSGEEEEEEEEEVFVESTRN